MKKFMILIIGLMFVVGYSPSIAETPKPTLQETIEKQCPSHEICEGSKLDPRKALADYNMVHVNFNEGFIISFYEAKGDEQIKQVAFAYYLYDLISFCYYDNGKIYMYSTIQVDDEWKCPEFHLTPENAQKIADDFGRIFGKPFPLF